jgi:DNA-directed RNA polymerase subunit RPC12/RpoP
MDSKKIIVDSKTRKRTTPFSYFPGIFWLLLALFSVVGSIHNLDNSSNSQKFFQIVIISIFLFSGLKSLFKNINVKKIFLIRYTCTECETKISIWEKGQETPVCPKCGENWVFVEEKSFDHKTKQLLSKRAWWGVTFNFSLGLILGFVVILCMIYPEYSEGKGILYFIFGISFTFNGIRILKGLKSVEKVLVNEYKCSVCGQTWTLFENGGKDKVPGAVGQNKSKKKYYP